MTNLPPQNVHMPPSNRSVPEKALTSRESVGKRKSCDLKLIFLDWDPSAWSFHAHLPISSNQHLQQWIIFLYVPQNVFLFCSHLIPMKITSNWSSILQKTWHVFAGMDFVNIISLSTERQPKFCCCALFSCGVWNTFCHYHQTPLLISLQSSEFKWSTQKIQIQTHKTYLPVDREAIEIPF